MYLGTSLKLPIPALAHLAPRGYIGGRVPAEVVLGVGLVAALFYAIYNQTPQQTNTPTRKRTVDNTKLHAELDKLGL